MLLKFKIPHYELKRIEKNKSNWKNAKKKSFIPENKLYPN